MGCKSVSVSALSEDANKVSVTESVTYTTRWEEQLYNLTINYVYGTNGATAKPSYVNTTLKYNEAYSVNSPSIFGYDANITTVSGNIQDIDTIITVGYFKQGYRFDFNNNLDYYKTKIKSDNTPSGEIRNYKLIIKNENSVTVPTSQSFDYLDEANLNEMKTSSFTAQQQYEKKESGWFGSSSWNSKTIDLTSHTFIGWSRETNGAVEFADRQHIVMDSGTVNTYFSSKNKHNSLCTMDAVLWNSYL
jgi:hypothetical protein